MKTLLIVESPHKAKAVAALARPALRGAVFAWACLGHLRDLPQDSLGVNLAGGFEPDYRFAANRVIPKNREKTVATLRQKIIQADVVLLATDPDREGEAVAWHVTQVFAVELRPKTVGRVAFNAITASAIQAAVQRPRALDMHLVMAAAARRVMDRLVGWFVSPVLWGAMKGETNLSAGRVQTATLRLLVEYEREQSARGQADAWEVQVEL